MRLPASPAPSPLPCPAGTGAAAQDAAPSPFPCPPPPPSDEQALLLKTPRGTDYGMVHNFLGAMENPFRAHKLWRDAAEDEMLLTLDALETYILRDPRIASSVLANMGPGPPFSLSAIRLGFVKALVTGPGYGLSALAVLAACRVPSAGLSISSQCLFSGCS